MTFHFSPPEGAKLVIQSNRRMVCRNQFEIKEKDGIVSFYFCQHIADEDERVPSAIVNGRRVFGDNNMAFILKDIAEVISFYNQNALRIFLYELGIQAADNKSLTDKKFLNKIDVLVNLARKEESQHEQKETMVFIGRLFSH